MLNFLLVTSGVHSILAGERRPWERLILPTNAAQLHDVPSGRVWWAERIGRRIYLRGVTCVVESRLERNLKTGAQHLAWNLSPLHTERATWPGAVTRPEARMSTLLADIAAGHTDSVSLLPLTAELDLALEERLNNLGDYVWRFDLAIPRLTSLFERTLRSRPAVELRSVSLASGWRYVRAYFAREELVGVGSCDPFVVAAAAISGCERLPDTFFGDGESGSGLVDSDYLPSFHELKEDEISFVENGRIATLVPRSSLEMLERASKRHQEILQALAKEMRGLGYKPTYNGHVDLRVEGNTGETFFEVKTATPYNYLHQVRLALGQLLEYRCRYDCGGTRQIRLAAVVEANGSSEDAVFAEGLLARNSISLIHCETNTLRLEGMVGALPGNPLRSGNDVVSLWK